MEPAVGAGAVPGVNVISFGTTASPLSLSLARTVGVVPPDAPFKAAGVSRSANISAAVTGIVTVAVAQLAGFSFSQI